MLGFLKYRYHLAQSRRHEAKKLKTRSPKWDNVQKDFLRSHSACAGCGSRLHLQVHHKKPFHLFPELELEPSNLIALCMDRTECHLRLGHGSNFKAFNPLIELHAAQSLRDSGIRPSLWAAAKAARKMEG